MNVKRRIGKLLYKFESTDESELQCDKGEKVIVDINNGQDGWSFCLRFSDPLSAGYVPTKYIEILEDENFNIHEHIEQLTGGKEILIVCQEPSTALKTDIVIKRNTALKTDIVIKRNALLHKEENAMRLLDLFRKYQMFLRFRRYFYSKKYKKQRNRLLMVNETISTELTYVQQLTFCIDHVKKPLEAMEIIDESQAKKLFCNMEDILSASTLLLSGFFKEKETNPNLHIAKYFVAHSRFSRLYNDYINNYDEAIDLLDQIKRNDPRMVAFDDRISNNQENRFQYRIHEWMIIPVMRVPRYRILLSNLMKYTRRDHEEYDDLRKALDPVGGICQFVCVSR